MHPRRIEQLRRVVWITFLVAAKLKHETFALRQKVAVIDKIDSRVADGKLIPHRAAGAVVHAALAFISPNREGLRQRAGAGDPLSRPRGLAFLYAGDCVHVALHRRVAVEVCLFAICKVVKHLFLQSAKSGDSCQSAAGMKKPAHGGLILTCLSVVLRAAALFLDQLHHRLDHKLRRAVPLAPGLFSLTAQQGDNAGALLGGALGQQRSLYLQVIGIVSRQRSCVDGGRGLF